MTRQLGQRRPVCGWGATAIPAWSCTSLGPNRSTKRHAPAILLSLCGRNLSTSLRGLVMACMASSTRASRPYAAGSSVQPV